jgi:2,4-dienoyl-CoA reductase-like NADH-dependent reductase (Old Yellow Enzyme family)
MNAAQECLNNDDDQIQHLALDTLFTLKNGTTLRNRLIKSAMSEQLGDAQHNPVEGLQTLYRTWAKGGQALNITGNIMVDRQALGEPGNVVLDEESNLDAFKQWAVAGTVNNTHLWMQLNHPGKQTPSFLASTPVAPSAIALEGNMSANFNPPRALSDGEIWEIVDRFATSALLAKQCGFSGVQIHGAHGYLVSQFLSPRHNHRTDSWGGCLANRTRFVREIYRAIRERVGESFPVGIKLNSADFLQGGFDETDSLQVVQILADDGIDLVEISGGSYEKLSFIEGTVPSARSVQREAFFIEYAEKLRQLTDVPLMVTGGFRSARGMLDAINNNATDFIGLGRSVAVEPSFSNQLMEDDSHGIQLVRRSTGFKKLDALSMIDVQWYQQQIVRLSKGLPSDPNMSEWMVLLRMAMGMGRHAFRRTRA